MSEENSYHDFDTLLLIDWIKANKGDLTRLRISGGTPELDIEAWENINEQHGQEFGTDRKHIAYLRLVKKLAMLELDFVITGDRFLQNNINIALEELEAFLKQISGDTSGGINETLIALTERTGTLITESNITAKYFFQMVKYYSKKK